MSAKQLPMFDLDAECGCKQKKYRQPTAFYIVRRAKDRHGDMREEMITDMDSDGRPIWAEHDLQMLIPFVFSSSQNARKWMQRWGGHEVRSTRYTHLVSIARRV